VKGKTEPEKFQKGKRKNQKKPNFLANFSAN